MVEAVYLETGVLVKYYVTEPGSSWVRNLVEETEERGGIVTRDILDEAAELCLRHPLKGYDAVHLATGIALRDSLGEEVRFVYVTGDASLAEAARLEGLTVENPFEHVAAGES